MLGELLGWSIPWYVESLTCVSSYKVSCVNIIMTAIIGHSGRAAMAT